MTALQLAVLAGMLIAGGLVGVVHALRPAPPALMAALDQVALAPASPTAVLPRSADGVVSASLIRPVRVFVERHLQVPDADLEILGWTREQLAARKLMLAATGLLAPSIVGACLAFAGLGAAAALPVILGLGVGAVGWFLPSQEARELAGKTRVEFRTNLQFLLTLVAGERRARGSVEQALYEAVRVSDTKPFVRMRIAIDSALTAGQKPWSALRALGDDLHVIELRNLADIASAAADGAAVYNTLLAEARALRHVDLASARADANAASERMSRPLAVLVLGLTVFVLAPFMNVMFGG